MKIANVKGMVVKGMMVAMAAGAFVLASPVKAQAQGFAVGVQFGQPAYAYDRRDGFEDRRFDFDRRRDFERREEIRRHEEWERMEAIRRHEAWERAHQFRGYYGYSGRDGYR